MIRVSLAQLPGPLVESIEADKFLFAYSLPEHGKYVARHLGSDGRLEELEYDVGLGRCLTRGERRRALPEPRRTTLPAEGVTVVATYVLDEATSVLHATLDVLDEHESVILTLKKQVYDPTPWDVAQVVELALKKHRFPAEYAAWPRAQKVSYWAATLHRFRRAHGESGRDEDEIYTPDLVRDMERIDPRVRDLLPDILAEVGWLEQTPAAEAIAAFTARVPIEPNE